MNGVVFTVSYLVVLLCAIALDWNKLQSGKTSQRIVYYLISFFCLGLLVSRHFHLNVPLPPRFVIHTISPWVKRVIGL
jgi:hypothetical protein